jgi:hypothetical protein
MEGNIRMSKKDNPKKAGDQGGRRVIDFEKEDLNGVSTKGRYYDRSVWADGRIVYREVKDDASKQ